MKCFVCGSENVDRELGECPECGFELVNWTGSGSQEEYEQIIAERAEIYRQDIREGISAGLIVMSYQRNREDLLEIKSEDKIFLFGKKSQEKIGTVQWYNEKFARIDAGEEMVLRLFTDSTRKGEVRKEIKMTAPDWGAVLWKIGIKEEERLHFRLVLGAVDDDSRRLESDSISMVC